jgi:hypothetical protein
MSTYTVARTVVYYFEIEAESEQQALVEVSEMPLASSISSQQVTQEVIDAGETTWMPQYKF